MKRAILLTTVSLLAPFASAHAQVNEVLVIGDAIEFRNRTPDVNPVLSYDLEYFQRFEPVSVGEMLKRVPGVTFTADVGEYDGVQMRGLSPEYSQIMINGRRMPGGEGDRSFFVDRIPAEMVERVKIIRSPSADMASEGVGGTLNVILKEGANLEGGFAKLGAIFNQDGKARASAAVAYADTFGDTSVWGALNYQGRRNAKDKFTTFWDGDFEELTGREFEDDTRDGVDISGNFDISSMIANGAVHLSGFFVNTDREEVEIVRADELEDDAFRLEANEGQVEDISQQSYSLLGDGEWDLGWATLGVNGAWAGFREDSTSDSNAEEFSYDDFGDIEEIELSQERETLDTVDDEFGAGAFLAFEDGGFDLKLGVDGLFKKRDGANRAFEFDFDDDEWEEETDPGAIYTIKETRIDPYIRVSYAPIPAMGIDLGLRAETTDRNVRSDNGTVDYEATEWNPSLHMRLSPTDDDQIRISFARTVRRPSFGNVAPYTQEEEPTDEDVTIGNPRLKNETSWGVDVGYERDFGTMGIFGVNGFYRHVSDMIDLVSIGDAPGLDGNLYTPMNVGDGFTYGIEFDVSTPLDIVGLPDTGVFANYTYLQSEVTDAQTGLDRRFRNQPSNVYNFGFIHSIPAWGVSFGSTYSGRDAGFQEELDEIRKIEYDGDLEAFVEKRFGDMYVLRFSVANILDRAKLERISIFDGDTAAEIIEARANNDVDESEYEQERSGAFFQVTLRAAF